MSPLPDAEAMLAVSARAVELARRAGADDTDAWFIAGRSASARVRAGEIDEVAADESRRLTVRVFVGGRTAMVSASDPSPADLAALAADAVTLARLADPDPCAGLPDGPFAEPPPTDALGLVDPALIDPDPMLLLPLAREADAATRGTDPRVRSGEGATASCWAGTTALANGRGFVGAYGATECRVWAVAAADDAGRKREGWWEAAGRTLASLGEPAAVGRTAALRTARRIGARPVATQEVPVVWAPEAARAFLEVIARAASGEERYRGATFLDGLEGQALASPLVSVADDATLLGRLGSRPFDAEGVASRRTPLFEAGAFRGFLHHAYSARRAGTASTGNAGRAGFGGLEAVLAVEPSNLVMEPGTAPAAAIVAGTGRGLYLTDMLGFGEDLAAGDFSRAAAGIWIEGGEMTFPVGEVSIAGRLPEILAGIDAVGSDVEIVGTVAAPTFRVGRMMIGGI